MKNREICSQMESYVIPDKLNKQIVYNISYIVTYNLLELLERFHSLGIFY